MPTSNLARIVFTCACFTLAPAFAFDGTRTPADVKPAVPQVSPREAFVSGAQSLRAGEKEKGLSALQYAAEQGHALAQWKLGRMYAAGDGVPRSDLRAFNYFSRIADTHAEDNPNMPQARFVANAFVQLGHYYMKGIPDSEVKVDQERAREMYAYAASYFGDPDAQYNLARLYLDGVGIGRDPRQAVRWLSLSANKGQARAQAVLGNVLFKGEAAPRQPALGLMWLTLARDNATPEDAWIAEMHDAAFKKASDDERQLALVFLERWLKNRRD